MEIEWKAIGFGEYNLICPVEGDGGGVGTNSGRGRLIELDVKTLI